MKFVNHSSYFIKANTQLGAAIDFIKRCFNQWVLDHELEYICIHLIESKKYDNNDAIIDTLGCFYPGNLLKFQTPYICLFVDRIKANTRNKEDFVYLFSKVLIHEMMHAWLNISDSKCFDYKREECKWREESYANALTLHVIRQIKNIDLFAYAKDYMENHQPDEYKLGVKIFNHCTISQIHLNNSLLKRNDWDEKFLIFWKECMQKMEPANEQVLIKFFEQTYLAGKGWLIYDSKLFTKSQHDSVELINSSKGIAISYDENGQQLPINKMQQYSFINAEGKFAFKWFVECLTIY